MKTTLKRGLGRQAAQNGNGRAILPPGTVSPVTRYRQPPPRRRGVFGLLLTIATWMLASLVVVAAGLASGAYLYLHETRSDIVATTPDVVAAQKTLDVAVAGEPATALVIGYDRRAGAEADVNGARSDTVMLLRADPDLQAVSMLSFPRDLVVTVRCEGRQFRARINEAYSECGAEGTLETVRALTGLPINYLITVNFHGFKQVVANLGGVWMDVDHRYFNDNSSGTNYATIDLQPGYQKLNGQQALDFVRYRHFDSDFYRLARQQLFVKAFNSQITESFSPSKVPTIIDVIKDNVEIGVAGGKALSTRTLISYGLLAYELPAGHFFQARIEPTCFGADDVAALTVDDTCIRRAVQDFAAPDVEAPEKATAVALGQKPKSAAPAPGDTTVLVLNGNGVAGSAADTSYQLGQLGYVTLLPPNNAPANAPTQDYFHSEVYFDPAQAGAELAARRVAALMGEDEVAAIPPGVAPLANGSMVVTVVGQRFTGQLASAPVDRTPERQPPAVAEASGSAIPLLQEAQAEVPFRVMNPTVVERTSSLAGTSPIRTYSMAGRPTVRLTFMTGASEYWGIQMVRWNDAPAIRQPNRSIFVKGRKYELHYVGPNLRMVVLRAKDGTTYWVVNTLMNTLSNETMLEIAKGLRPLAPASD